MKRLTPDFACAAGRRFDAVVGFATGAIRAGLVRFAIDPATELGAPAAIFATPRPSHVLTVVCGTP